MNERLRRGLFPPLLLLLAGLWAYHALWDGQNLTLFALPDNGRQQYPWYAFLTRALSQGQLPLWDPFTFSGNAFMGNIPSAVFYPPHLLAFLAFGRDGTLPLGLLDALVVLHGWMGAIFMFGLARTLRLGTSASLVAGLVWGYSGWIANQASEQLCVYESAVWIPLTVLLMVRALRARGALHQLGWAVLCALSLALTFQAGHFQPVYHTVVVLTGVAGFALYRELRRDRAERDLRRLALVLASSSVFFVLVDAVQILPSFELLGSSYRWVGLPEPVYGMQRVPFEAGKPDSTTWSTLKELVQDPMVTNAAGSLRRKSPYFGIGAFALALVSLPLLRRSPLVAGSLALCGWAFLDALGPGFPLHRVMWLFFPLADKVREPDRSLVLFQLGGALLAAAGFDALRLRLARADDATRVGLALMAAPLFIATTQVPYPFRAGLLALGLVVQVALLETSATRLRVLRACAFLLVLWEIGRPMPGRWPKSLPWYPGTLFVKRPITDFLLSQRTEPESFRVSFLDTGANEANWGDVYAMSTTLGYGPSMYGPTFDLLGLDWSLDGRVLDLLAARYVVTDSPQEKPGLKLVLTDGPLRLYERERPLPMAWIASRVETPPRDRMGERLRALPREDFEKTAILEPDAAVSLPGTATGSVRVTEKGLRRLAYVTETTGPALLVTSESWYPGWRATVDGQRAPVLRAHRALRASPVPAGRHVVVHEFQPASFFVGLAFTTLALLLATALGIAIWWRGRASSRTVAEA